MPITVDSQSAGFSTSTNQGVKIFQTPSSTAISSATNKIATSKLSTRTANLKGSATSGGVSILAGVNIETAFASSGTVGTGATNTFSMHTAKATLEAALDPDPTITITSSSDNTVRTYTRNLSGEVGSFVIEFDEGAELAQTITISALKTDGTTITKTFEGAAVGFNSGDLTGSNVGFAIWDAAAGSDSAKSEDAAANLRTAMLSANGFGDAANGDYLDVYANVASEAAGAAIDLGKVCVYQRVPGTAGNTALTSSATAATATFTFEDKPNEGSTITLVDTDGTSVVFEIDDTEDGVTGSNIAVTEIAENGGSGTGTAVDLVAKINAQASLDITATNPSAGRVDLVQGATGSASNKTITVNDASHWNLMVTGDMPSGFTSGIAFDDHLSTAVPAGFTGGLATTHSHAAGEFNGGHSPQWAAYDLATLINDVTNGSPGITAVSVNNRVTCTNTALGTIGNSSAISYSSTFPNITSVLPAGNFSGAVAPIPCNFGYEQSFDGVTWTSTTEVIADVAANVTGLKLATVNLPSAIAPYIRWVVNSNGGNLGSTSGIVSIKHTGG